MPCHHIYSARRHLRIDWFFINREFDLDTKPESGVADLSGNRVTTMQVGAVLGAFRSSPLADRKGRKHALLAVAITGVIGGLIQAFLMSILSSVYGYMDGSVGLLVSMPDPYILQHALLS
jgi:hypothetical protein